MIMFKYDNNVLVGEIEFQRIADRLPTLCWMADKDGKVVYRNKRWYDYCGVPYEVGLEADWLSFYDPAILPTLLDHWDRSIENGSDFKETYPLLGADGKTRSYMTHAVPIKVNGMIVRWLGISVDVTEHLRIEKELRASEDLLRSLNQNLEIRVEERAQALQKTEEQLRQSQKMEAVGQLTGGLAHDFNNILTGIMGNLELMQTRIQQRRFDDLGRFINSAQSAGHRAASLTQRLLAFSRRQTLDPKPTHILDLVKNMEDLLERTIGPQVSLYIETKAFDGLVLIDAPQLENALLNLCINSRDAMPNGGTILISITYITIDYVKAKIYDIQPGSYVQIKVVDNGCGMDEKTMSKAFDPFFTTKPIGQGTGLGLSMIYGFSRQSKGHVTIDSIVNQGTSVSIILPRLITEGAQMMTEVPVEQSSLSAKANVLLVDDEATIRYLLGEVLAEAGYHITEAGNGIEALRILESDALLDLLITDVGLPDGMNGKQVADAALSLRPGIKILFITGYAESSVMGDKGFGDGVELLTKPFALQEVVKSSDRLLNK